MTNRMIRCVHGPNEQRLDLGGLTVGWVRVNLRDALNLGYYSEAYVNGWLVPHGYALVPGDESEFLCRFGFKSSADRPPEALRARALLAGYPELSRIGKAVKAMGLDPDAAVEMTLALVAQFLERMFGPVPVTGVPTLSLIVDLLTRIEGRIALLSRIKGQLADGPPLSIKQASEATNLSETHLRRAIARGDLTASNVGTAGRPLWRILPADLFRWFEARKGGSRKVPPRSDLKDLIRRHLPGL